MAVQNPADGLQRHAGPRPRRSVARRHFTGVSEAGLGLVASIGLGGALIYALQTRDAGPRNEELYSTTNRPTADGLAGLPRDYTGPRLGPPLLGDLGRPILSAQDRGQPVVPPSIQPTVDAAEQRRLAEAEAARTSRVFFQTQVRTVAASTAPGGAATTANLTGLGLPGQFTPTVQERAQERQLAFLNAAADRRTVAPDRVMPPASPYVLQAGAVIPAALITGIRSDLPGQITAQVTENIYDSPTGRILLVPQGTRIIGQYDNAVQFGHGLGETVEKLGCEPPRGRVDEAPAELSELAANVGLHGVAENSRAPLRDERDPGSPFRETGRAAPSFAGDGIAVGRIEICKLHIALE
ncbi:MAG: Conjugative transfer protein TrbI [Afipia sp.]|nr:MAG: Conjugative transfer protein TrbI [Afipia sp.]